jgi:translation initiation factor 3 subunit B
MENGYHIYDFRGNLLREEHIDRFKQFVWRPRPPTLLSKEEQSEIRKNLRNYSRMFDEQDLAKKNTANRAVVEARKRLLDEWIAWRKAVVEDVEEEAEEIGWKGPETDGAADDGTAEEIEEIVEEIIEETEEVIG